VNASSGSRRVALALAAASTLVAAAATGADPAEDEAPPGRALYEQYCVTCHGVEGRGDGPAGLSALPMPRDFTVGQFKFDADGDGRTGTDRDLFLVIRDGGAAVGGNPLMAPWGHLGDERIRELVAYVRSLERPRSAGYE
jgi:mono/diheme cytochrome c family protein